MSGINLPKNAHVSTHPCLQAKLSQLRSASTGSKDAQTLVHELALMVGYEALAAGLKAQEAGTVRSPIPSRSHSPGHIMPHSGVVLCDIFIEGFPYPQITQPTTIAAMLYHTTPPTNMPSLGQIPARLRIHHNHHLPLTDLDIARPHPPLRPLHGPRAVLPAPHARARPPPRSLPREIHLTTRRILQQPALPHPARSWLNEAPTRAGDYCRSHHRDGCDGTSGYRHAEGLGCEANHRRGYSGDGGGAAEGVRGVGGGR